MSALSFDAAPDPRRAVARPAGRGPLHAYLAEARYECIRMLRAPAFAAPLLGVPVLLYLLFGVAIAGHEAARNPAVARFLFAAFTVLGVVGPGIFGFGAALAVEREQGLLRLKRALPAPAAAPLVARTAMALLFAAVVMVLVLVPALLWGHLRLSAAQVVAVLLTGILGSLPFAALGLWIGVRVSGRSAPGWVNLVYFPMLYLSGLFFPMPGLLRTLEPIWPAYHLDQLMLAALGGESSGSALLHAGVLAAVTVVCGAFAVQRLARVG